MIFNVVTSIQAEEDLRGIFEYIAFELLSPENATGQLERLEKQICPHTNGLVQYRKIIRKIIRK